MPSLSVICPPDCDQVRFPDRQIADEADEIQAGEEST